MSRAPRLSLIKQSKPQIIRTELYERLDESDLKNIYEWFLINDESEKRMTKTQLRKVLEIIAKISFSDDDEYDRIFSQMNIKQDGNVTWDEFVSFLMLTHQHKTIKPGPESLGKPIRSVPIFYKSRHRFAINKICFNPTITSDRIVDWNDGNVMTGSSDGTINYWSLDFTHQRTIRPANPSLRVQQAWILDFITLTDVSIVCISSTERDLRFYDTAAGKFQIKIIFTSLPYLITAMYYHFYEDAKKESILICGDNNGWIHVIFIQSANRGPFRSKLDVPLLTVRYDQVLNGGVEGFRIVLFKRQHSDYIRQVYYYPNLNTVISCSDDRIVPLLMIDIHDKSVKYVYKTNKSVWCFDVCKTNKIIVSGSSDSLIKVWNLFLIEYPIAVLYGHYRPIVGLALQDDGRLLYSLSEDKYIKVWDLTEQKCLQNYLDLSQELSENSKMTCLYNPESRQWIIASSKIAVLSLNPKQNAEQTDGQTHTEGVSVVLYNPLFKVVITCGLDSNIIVWNPWDGRRLKIIKQAHTRSVYSELISIEITAASFSPEYHRLISGAHDGTIKIWNFNTGVCLRNMNIESDTEIKSIIWIKERILVMGWNRRITEFADNQDVIKYEGELFKNWIIKHTEHISCGAVRIPECLVTCTYNGELIMWKLETGNPYKQYNVLEPTTRIKIQHQILKEKDTIQQSVKFDRRYNKRPIQRKAIKSSLTSARRISNRSILQPCVPLRKLAVYCTLFLDKRTMLPTSGTLLVALENGIVQIWSHHPSGGFLTSFSAIHKAGDYVTSMTTDMDNEYLFTGTSIGYIKTWFLRDYCLADNIEIEHVSMPKLRLKFPFLWGDLFKGRAARMVRDQPKPILLNSYRAHTMTISALQYIDEAEILISSSIDNSARMWTLSGRYLQTIGTFKEWKFINSDPKQNDNFEFTIPPEINRCASSTTLRVLGGGKTLRQLNFKQLQARVEKNLLEIDTRRIYGKRLEGPVLGNHYQSSEQQELPQNISFDTTFPHIPVYQHLIMPPVDAIIPKLP